MGIFTSETIEIKVIEEAGGCCCVATGDGKRVHDRIAAIFRENKKVELSFEGTKDLTPAFLNAALGQLYGSFSEEYLQEKLAITGLDPDDKIILKRVMERAKGYFENAETYRKAVRDVLGGEDDY